MARVGERQFQTLYYSYHMREMHHGEVRLLDRLYYHKIKIVSVENILVAFSLRLVHIQNSENIFSHP